MRCHASAWSPQEVGCAASVVPVPVRGEDSGCGHDRSLRAQQRAWATSSSTSTFHSCRAGCTDDVSALIAYWSMFHIPVPARPRTNVSEPSAWTGTRPAIWLLRKEVIQPHLPVRLPCYDLVLIASPTFDGSLHKGWATGFGCYRLS
jgi:hypothetical protein